MNLLDRILGSTGQERTAALRDLGRRAEYYVPPELRGILGFAAEMTPSETLNRAAVAGGEMLAPGRTPMQRVGSLGRMLSETAGVAAPIAAGPRAGMTAAQSLQEGLLGFSMAADDAGRRFVERMNQPGPVPTMYSGPAGFADYLKRVNPRGVRVAAEDRPNLMMGDMYGMLPSGAKRVGKQGDVTFYRGQDGDFYATAFNPDVGEQDVVGYIMPRGDMTELAVVDEMQGKGIGGELQYLFRKENPDAPTGGLTEAGEKALRKTYERLSSEGLLGNPVGRAAGDGIEATLRAKYPDAKIYISGDASRGYTLSQIELPKNMRNSGVGSNIMQDFVSMADAQGAKINLTPSKAFGGSVARLKDFYKRFGFVENKGKNKDFSTRETMYREPSAPTLPAPRNEAEAMAKQAQQQQKPQGLLGGPQ